MLDKFYEKLLTQPIETNVMNVDITDDTLNNLGETFSAGNQVLMIRILTLLNFREWKKSFDAVVLTLISIDAREAIRVFWRCLPYMSTNECSLIPVIQANIHFLDNIADLPLDAYIRLSFNHRSHETATASHGENPNSFLFFYYLIQLTEITKYSFVDIMECIYQKVKNERIISCVKFYQKKNRIDDGGVIQKYEGVGNSGGNGGGDSDCDGGGDGVKGLVSSHLKYLINHTDKSMASGQF